jgi:hypothetical protein
MMSTKKKRVTIGPDSGIREEHGGIRLFYKEAMEENASFVVGGKDGKVVR